jgi:hypothetical protein
VKTSNVAKKCSFYLNEEKQKTSVVKIIRLIDAVYLENQQIFSRRNVKLLRFDQDGTGTYRYRCRYNYDCPLEGLNAKTQGIKQQTEDK